MKSIFFTLTMPGIGIVLIPWGILRLSGPVQLPALSVINLVAGILWFYALFALLYSIWGFAVYGKGTLAPVDPPEIFVNRGLYQYTRNPMYLSVLCILISEAVLFKSATILIYTVIVFILFHLFVVLYEEPRLHKQFGSSFKMYCESVPRWGIRIKSIQSNRVSNQD